MHQRERHPGAPCQVFRCRLGFGAPRVAPGGDAVQGHDVQLVRQAEVDIIAAHEERERQVCHVAERKREEPPAAIVDLFRGFVAAHAGKTAEVDHVLLRLPDVAGLAGRLEQRSLFVLQARIVAEHHRAGNGKAVIDRKGEQGHGAPYALGLAGSVVVHEQDVAEDSGVHRLDETAAETAGSAEIRVCEDLHVFEGAGGQAAAIIDDEQLDRAERRTGACRFREGLHRGLRGGLALKGGHDGGEADLAARRLVGRPSRGGQFGTLAGAADFDPEDLPGERRQWRQADRDPRRR